MSSRKSAKWLSGIPSLFVTGTVVLVLGTGVFGLSNLTAGGDKYGGSKSKVEGAEKTEIGAEKFETVEVEVKSGKIGLQDDKVEAGAVKFEIKNEDSQVHTLNIERTDQAGIRQGQGEMKGEHHGDMPGAREDESAIGEEGDESSAQSDEPGSKPGEGETPRMKEPMGHKGLGTESALMKNIKVQPGETKEVEFNLLPGEYRIVCPELSHKHGEETTLTVVDEKK